MITSNIFFLTILLISFTINHISTKRCFRKEHLINLSNYTYPSPTSNDHTTVAILNTNDIHGFAYKQDIKLGNDTYYISGLENLGGYILALRTEFKKNFLWLDSGDQFSGTFESKLTDGKIVADILNSLGLDAATIGNHEFDWGNEKMNRLLKQAKFPYIGNNIIRKDQKKLNIENYIKYKIFNVENGIRIGVTGITTVLTPQTTSGDTTPFIFLEYKELIVKYAKKLRDEGANLVILLSHSGIDCQSRNPSINDYLKLRLTTLNDDVGICTGNEIFDLINILPENTIDAVYAGHVHKDAHSFYKGIPILQNNFHAINVNVGYFSFDKKTKKYIKAKTVIEGPIPICSRIFSKSSKCNVFDNKIPLEKIFQENGNLSNFTFHGHKITPLQSVETILKAYRQDIEDAKNQTIFNLNFEMKRESDFNSPLSNFACDMAKNITKTDFCILNQGMFRGIWYPGNVSYYKYYEMFSLVNELVVFQVTGSKLKQIMKIINCGKLAFYGTSGLTSFVKKTPKKCLVNLKESDGKEIDDKKTYSVASINFLIKGGDDFADVVKVFKINATENYGEFRDITIDYLKMHPFITREMVAHLKDPSLIFV